MGAVQGDLEQQVGKRLGGARVEKTGKDIADDRRWKVSVEIVVGQANRGRYQSHCRTTIASKGSM